MVPLINVVLILSGLSVFYLRNARNCYFEIALGVFATILMATILIISEQYSMLGRIYFPLFYWGLLSFPLFLFSRSKLLSFVWCALFFTGLFYYLGDSDSLNSGSVLQFRLFLYYLLCPLLGLSLYLASGPLQTNKSMQQALQISIYIYFISIFFLMDFNVFLAPYKGISNKSINGFSEGHFNYYLALTAVIGGLIISTLKTFSPRQKILLIAAIFCLIAVIFSEIYLLTLVLLMTLLISMLLFYASVHFRLATDILAIIASMQLSITLFKILFPSPYFYPSYVHLFFILSLFIGSLLFYIQLIRRKIL